MAQFWSLQAHGLNPSLTEYWPDSATSVLTQTPCHKVALACRWTSLSNSACLEVNQIKQEVQFSLFSKLFFTLIDLECRICFYCDPVAITRSAQAMDAKKWSKVALSMNLTAVWSTELSKLFRKSSFLHFLVEDNSDSERHMKTSAGFPSLIILKCIIFSHKCPILNK